MSCDCYKIGGPWIAEDPNCPVHGTEAQWRAELQQEWEADIENRLSKIEQRINEVLKRMEKLDSR